MKILNVTRGSYKEVIVGEGPYVRIDGMDMNGTGWLQTDFNISMKEKNSVVECFNDINHVYAFGHDPINSMFSVSFLIFIGKECMENDKFSPGDGVDGFIRKYISARVSRSKSVARITYNSGSYFRGMVTAMSVSVYDEEMNTVLATVSGSIFADTD